MIVTLFGLFRLPYVPGIRVFGQRVKKQLAEDNQRVVLGAVWRQLGDGE
jgi:hypothetical protein